MNKIRIETNQKDLRKAAFAVAFGLSVGKTVGGIVSGLITGAVRGICKCIGEADTNKSVKETENKSDIGHSTDHNDPRQ